MCQRPNILQIATRAALQFVPNSVQVQATTLLEYGKYCEISSPVHLTLLHRAVLAEDGGF